MAVTVRMRWSGQGFGDLLMKSGVGIKVTWIIVLPEEVKLGFGVGFRSFVSECPQRQNQATEQKT